LMTDVRCGLVGRYGRYDCRTASTTRRCTDSTRRGNACQGEARRFSNRLQGKKTKGFRFEARPPGYGPPLDHVLLVHREKLGLVGAFLRATLFQFLKGLPLGIGPG